MNEAVRYMVEEALKNPDSAFFKPLDLHELMALPDPEWIIEGFIQLIGNWMLHGDPGGGKTFVTLDMLLHIVSGLKTWAGMKIPKKRKVLVVLAEGVEFYKYRVDAWIQSHPEADLGNIVDGFFLYPDAVNILNDEAIAKIAVTAQKYGAEMIVYDTYSRMIVGRDENSSEVGSVVIDNIDVLSKALKCSIGLIHHNNKAGGFRGTTGVDGGLDARFELRKVGELGELALVSHKAKNSAKGGPLKFYLAPYGKSVVAFHEPGPWTPPAATTSTWKNSGDGLAF